MGREVARPLVGSDRRDPERLSDLEAAVDCIIGRAGPHIVAATPLGIGKPNRLLNALYARVKAEPERLSLTLYTALSLPRPRGKSDLERRFLAPFVERHFGADYPDLDYLVDRAAGLLAVNVRVHEFYFASGSQLGNADAQRHYISQNYTHVARDLAAAGVNVMLQQVARRGERFSLSSNPDVSLDLVDRLAARGKRLYMVGVVHQGMPFLGGEADLGPDHFDLLLDAGETHKLFAIPREAVTDAEHALGLHASTLVKDGGTLQIGIGALSDALVHALLLRHQDNGGYRAAVQAVGGAEPSPLVHEYGGLEPFEQGLYGATEMVMDGFMHLRQGGILKRLVGDGAGENPHGGRYLEGAFFLGSHSLYDWLRGLDGEDWDGLVMARVSHVNELYGGRENLDRAQRCHARFFNTCMMQTLLGAAVSDGFADGQVLSGVGGQYNFVAMAHALADGRSILLLRSTHLIRGHAESSIVWNYGHITIPRHLRDIVVTEYGVADLRGQCDEEVILRLLAITDARFQKGLVETAQRAGKLDPAFHLPKAWSANTPQALSAALRPLKASGAFGTFPFGSDFDAIEQRLLPALGDLKRVTATLLGKVGAILRSLMPFVPAGDAEACLARLGLDAPHGIYETVLARLVGRALAGKASLEAS